jgi:DNA invertase Pin-like site-specific DNA recombinase
VRRPVSAAPGRWTRASCRRVESGESQGIIAYKLSRFGRGAPETLQAVERIRNARGRPVTVEDGVDSAKPGGRLLLTVLAGLAVEGAGAAP